MGFGQAIKHVFSNYANFKGRASRSEFWWWYLFVVIGGIIVSIPLNAGITSSLNSVTVDDVTGTITGGEVSTLTQLGIILAAVWTVALLLPTLAVGCRRLHDTDRSGWWWLLYYFCCIVGAIVVIIFWIGPSTPGPNRYGDGPATGS